MATTTELGPTITPRTGEQIGSALLTRYWHQLEENHQPRPHKDEILQAIFTDLRHYLELRRLDWSDQEAIAWEAWDEDCTHHMEQRARAGGVTLEARRNPGPPPNYEYVHEDALERAAEYADSVLALMRPVLGTLAKLLELATGRRPPPPEIVAQALRCLIHWGMARHDDLDVEWRTALEYAEADWWDQLEELELTPRYLEAQNTYDFIERHEII